MDTQMVFKRYELKYLLSGSQQEALLRGMEPYMTADRFFHSSIRNLYYDTTTYRLIRQSLERPVYKEKLRLRSYGRAGEQDTVFLELKKKYEAVVYKRRLTLPQNHARQALLGLAPLPDSQIGRELGAALEYYQELLPQVFLSYQRDAYRSPDSQLRITFDWHIRYRTQELTLDSEPWGTELLAQDRVLMELKLQDAMPLWLARLLSQLEITKTSFSKYGTAYRQLCAAHREGALRYA